MTVTALVNQRLLECTDYNSFVELFERQAERYHDRVFALCQSPNNTSDIEFSVTYGDLDRISNYLAHEWSFQLGGVQRVGLISNEPLHSLVVMLTVLKLGRIFNPISAWNSETAITDSLIGTNTQYLIASEECSQIARTCANRASIPHVKILESLNEKRLVALSSGYNKSIRSTDRPTAALNDIILTTYTSGTTGPPKPYHISNQYFMMAMINAVQENKIDSKPCYQPEDTLITSTALFYVTGLIIHWSVMVGGSSVFLFHKSPTNTQDITEVILSVAAKCNATILSVFPLNLEKLAKYIQAKGDSEVTTRLLKQFKFCFYGGAPLSKEVGDFLHSKGLNVRCAYGTTEASGIAASDLSKDNPHWYTVKLYSSISKYCRWEAFDDGLYHLMIRGDCPTLAPAAAAKYGPDGYYQTKDLFREEPPMSGWWHHIGRVSEVIILNNSVKVDPAPLENKILEASIIKRCMIIGHNRSHIGVLIELDMEQADNYQLEQISSEVYEAINRSSRETAAQKYSEIAVPEMVYILPAHRKLPITPAKGTIARKQALEQFEQEIDEMYKNFVEH